ncbi:efflux RND transporter periplasmic adaptor subunit [Gemmatimonas sp.]|jgi:RND family efflux transporter MFP subunit|uniref:efflux RND transporter periplasmic adaptor subunit n=1 Tax=Gemmatimonas sp. TaxID=1962908 RepID=UPI0037C17E71
MISLLRRSAPVAFLVMTVVSLTACGKKTEAPDATATGATQTIGPDNIAVATADTLSSGPAISGTLAADREARIRAEVAGAVRQTYVDAGQRVTDGMVLARIEDAAVRDAAMSARSAVTQATVSAEQIARELQRAKTLAAAGAIAERDVEIAERANLSAQAALADAKARQSSADKNLRNTQIRAPFAGIVAEKTVSPGDIVAPGTALFTVIDPRSLRVEASVPAVALSDVRVGAPVTFTVNGTDRELRGTITRVAPMVNAQTKQVDIQASVPNDAGMLVAGLFVEGRVAAQKRVGVLVPEQAVDQTGIVPNVMRLKGGKVEKVEIQIGLRDEVTERVEVTIGLASGDTVLLGAARGISAGVAITVSAPADAAARAASPSAAVAPAVPAKPAKN